MGDKLPLVANDITADGETSNISVVRTSVTPTNAQNTNVPIRKNSSRTPVHNHYEELMDGVPCPSCHGTGKIPKELEKRLVALIPIDDIRLKPRRTLMWVAIAVSICVLICGLLLFFLIPRSISVTSDDSPVSEVTVVQYSKNEKMVLNFINSVNVSNGNFFAVKVVNATSNVIKVVFPDTHEVIGRGAMLKGSLSVPMQSSSILLPLNHTVTVTDWALAMCELPYGYVRLYFQFTVTFEYFAHREQDTYESSQLICCTPPAGNCTNSLTLIQHRH